VANRLLQLCWLFPTDCLLSHIIVKNVHDLSNLIIKFTGNGPESPVLSKTRMNGRSLFGAGVEAGLP
jgi:hypothetical protein